MINYKTTLTIVAVACLFAGSSIADYGTNHQVNIGGATLFQSFFEAKASTNDYFDVDGDGWAGYDPMFIPPTDQLAKSYPNSDPNNRWWVLYRGVGSGNGLKELVNYHRTAPGMELGYPSDAGLINRTYFYHEDTGLTGFGDSSKPGGAPIDINNVDIAVMDVPTKQFVQEGSEANAHWSKTPGSNGYGKNPVIAWDGPFQKGSEWKEQSNKLKTLVSSLDPNVVLNTTEHDANTVYDTPLSWVPISIISNQGTGLQNVSQQQLMHLFTTGRMPSGKNYVAASRDSGSGTRNGAMSSIGVDPSWARGENIGLKQKDENITKVLGPNHQPSNLGGSSRMEDVVRARRLSVGYTGIVGGSRSAADASAGKYEILNIKWHDGNQYVRPSKNNILNNEEPDTGWRMGGKETFATVGDPFETGSNPGMDNPYAADYIKNIKSSIDGFTDPCDPDPNLDMPGQYLAKNYFLLAGVNDVPDPEDPDHWIDNDDYVQGVNTYISTHGTLVVPAYGIHPTGDLPKREVLTGGATYTDGETGANGYIQADGSYVYSGDLAERNKIQGDFLYDGKCDIADTCKMLEAFAYPRAFEQNVDHGGDKGDQSGDYVIVEVIGDLTGDGNFDEKDVRYFADGMATCPVTGNLDRSNAFQAVDMCWNEDPNYPLRPAGNFFATSLHTGKDYEAGSGWSKADIAGRGKVTQKGEKVITPGANPEGSDGSIDCNDISYIQYVLRHGMEVDAFDDVNRAVADVYNNRMLWRNLDDAVWMDLSCDMNGDRVLDKSDIDMVVKDILGTDYGDVDLDGDVDDDDMDIILNNIDPNTYGATWCEGDMDGDGYVTVDDLYMAAGTISPDLDGDGIVNWLDLAILVDSWLE